jgi:patatin-like phospholipase/acyl hydrolase
MKILLPKDETKKKELLDKINSWIKEYIEEHKEELIDHTLIEEIKNYNK